MSFNSDYIDIDQVGARERWCLVYGVCLFGGGKQGRQRQAVVLKESARKESKVDVVVVAVAVTVASFPLFLLGYQ